MKLTQLYKNREDFIIIGLTGRTGSGCSQTSEWFSTKDFEKTFKKPDNSDNDNDGRKYKICYDFLKQKWKPFYVIKYSKILSLMAYKEKLENFEELLINTKDDFSTLGFDQLNFDTEKEQIDSLKNSTGFEDIDIGEHVSDTAKLFDFFESDEFKKFDEDFHEIGRTSIFTLRGRLLYWCQSCP